MLAAFDEGLERGLERLTREVGAAAERERGWSARVCAGLEALLGFLDDERRWARLFLSEAPPKIELECAQRVQGLLRQLLHDRREADHGRERQAVGEAIEGPPELTRELILGGVFSVIRCRLLDDADTPGALAALAPSLMSFIMTAYLGQAGASQYAVGTTYGDGREQPSIGEVEPRGHTLPIRATYRTACVLRAIDGAPGSSNREVAQAAELTDEGQTSKLLSRLERRGLIENAGLGAAYGEPNAWHLTDGGRSVVKAIGHGFAVGAALGRGRRVRGAA